MREVTRAYAHFRAFGPALDGGVDPSAAASQRFVRELATRRAALHVRIQKGIARH